MRVLGLTGGIGMGKSTAAAMLRRLSVPVHDADAAVHALLARGGAGVAPVARVFPAASHQGAIDRRRLGAIVFADPRALARLETILHPLVRAAETRFRRRQRRRGAKLIALDIPLLFETGAERRVDRVLVVTAPAFLQFRRVLARPGAAETGLAAAMARQLPDAIKRRRADDVVGSGLGRAYTFRRLRAIVRRERQKI